MARLYTKKVWLNDQTKLSAKNLNHIEKGIEAVAEAVDEIEAQGNVHTHNNKTILDATTEAFTTELKEKYDTIENQLEAFKDKAIIGEFNANNENTLLEVGNGTIETPSNAFEIYKDGNVKVSSGILTIGNTTITEEQLQQLLMLIQG